MADQEHVDILRRSVKEWNRWRDQHHKLPDLSGANLSGAKLSGADFDDVNLIGANLSGANLISVTLSGADCTGATLSGADLSFANLMIADFSKANFISADLSGANLSGANLNGTDFSGAMLQIANFNEANLSDATLIGATLNDVNFNEANLSNANFSETTVWATIFGNVDLRTVKGLETVHHRGPSTIGTNTLERSHGKIPEVFLRGAGLSDTFIRYTRTLVSKPSDYYTCFISYSSKDEVFAKQLHSDLQREGVLCWIANEDMDIGDKIKYRIDSSIRKYDKLLLILSKHSIDSTWVAYEVERALSKEPTGVQNVLYPIRLDKAIMTCDKEWAKEIKDTRHIGNFEAWKTNHDAYQASFKLLLRALKAKNTTSKEGR